MYPHPLTSSHDSDAPLARLMIVDDEPDGAKTLGMLLEHLGHPVLVVTDSTKCLSAMETFKPDVVFLDIAMPNISGHDLTKQIRTRPEFESVAIIAVSGFADGELEHRSCEADCDQHLAKPVPLSALEAAISHEAKRRRGH